MSQLQFSMAIIASGILGESLLWMWRRLDSRLDRKHLEGR